MNLINYGNFLSHSGLRLPYKIDCDALSDRDIESLGHIIAGKIPAYDKVVGIPQGGLRIANALQNYINPHTSRTLIVDDVLTTGKSMEEMRLKLLGDGFPIDGVVIFARTTPPPWIRAVFTVW